MIYLILFKMVARGKECSDLFPSVVKNVVSKDPEVRNDILFPCSISLGQKVGICLFDALCRGATGSRTPLNIYISAFSQGLIICLIFYN